MYFYSTRYLAEPAVTSSFLLVCSYSTRYYSRQQGSLPSLPLLLPSLLPFIPCWSLVVLKRLFSSFEIKKAPKMLLQCTYTTPHSSLRPPPTPIIYVEYIHNNVCTLYRYVVSNDVTKRGEGQSWLVSRHCLRWLGGSSRPGRQEGGRLLSFC